MNMSGSAKKRRVPTRWALQSQIHVLAKRIRKGIVSLQHSLRRPWRAVALLFAAAVVLAVIFKRATLNKAYHIMLRSHPTHAVLARAHQPQHIGSAFSEEACEKAFDQAWAVRKDDGKEAASMHKVPIAYFVQVGNDSVPLLSRLFDRIHQPENVYVLHVDAKVDMATRSRVADMVESDEKYAKNVHIMESEMVTYKAISMVTNTIAAMTLALEKSKDWKYFINLSGADYPLVAPERQMLLLARPRVPFGRLNFVTFFPEKEWKPYQFRIRNMHWDPAAVGYQSEQSKLRLLRGLKENPLEPHRGFVFTKAEAWMILSRPFVSFVVRSAFAKRMLINHMHVLSVPEHYFADVLYNHPFWRKTIVPDALRKVVWYLRNRRSGQHPFPLDGGPTVMSRWEYIANTRSLFARKFVKPDSELMDAIDLRQSGAGLTDSDPRVNDFENDRQVFYNRIVRHFDALTKKSLELQGYTPPRGAFPNTY